MDTHGPDQKPLFARATENEKLPVILDITVASPVTAEPANWSKMRPIIESLRT